MSMTERLRALMTRKGLIVAPVCYDPLTARIIENLGFDVAYLGGFATGATLCTSEPLTTMTEMVFKAKGIVDRLGIPLVVDAGAGYGEPLHVMRTVQEFERCGVAGIHIEDQHYPKRAHYHKGVEQIITAESMVAKIKAALRAREHRDFVIIARTDAMRTDGFDEGIRRANIYAEAGADMAMIFPNNEEEAVNAPREIQAPLVYVNSQGNRLGRPIFSVQRLSDMGYKMVLDAITAPIVAFRAVKNAYEELSGKGSVDFDQQEMIALRQEIENTIGLEDYYRIEEETVETRSDEGR